MRDTPTHQTERELARFLENEIRINKLLEQFEAENKFFLRDSEIIDLVEKAIKDTGKGHRKLYSRKHLAKLEGKVITEHRKARRTCVFIELETINKKLAFEFHVVNYFKTPEGMVYLYRCGMDDTSMHFFTAHFFDRLWERSIEDADGRTSVIFEFMKKFGKKGIGLGSHVMADGEIVLDCHTGIGLGVACMTDRKAGYGLMAYGDHRTRPAARKEHHHQFNSGKPDRVFVSFCQTYVSNEMMNEEQRRTTEFLKASKTKKLVEEYGLKNVNELKGGV